MSSQHFVEYNSGSGNELDGKMKALRSSSAMTFNFLGNGPFSFEDDSIVPAGTYSVEFEYQLPTLANNPHPADLDAFLCREDAEVEVYCEMKMLEWLTGQPGSLRYAYLEPENYLIPQEETEAFVRYFREMSGDDRKLISDGRLPACTTRYDIFQMAKHVLAVYGSLRKRGKLQSGRVVLVNSVWELDDPSRLGRYEHKYLEMEEAEHEEFGACFGKSFDDIRGLFGELGIQFEVLYCPATALIDCNPPERKVALQRYVV